METAKGMKARHDREREADLAALELGLARKVVQHGIMYWNGGGSHFRAGYEAGKAAQRSAEMPAMTAQEGREQVIEWAKQCGFASHVALLQEVNMREFTERFFSNLERFAALVAASRPVARTPLSEHEQALQFLASLHPCPTIDGPPMALAELIFDAVQADRRALVDEIAKQEKSLDWMRKELAKRAHGITQEKQG